MEKLNNILNGNIEKSIVDMTNSISLGFLCLFTFNLVDTFFISQLGSQQLASISFGFPIVFLWMNVFFGINTGITAQIGKAYGNNDLKKVNSLILTSLLFTIIISLIISFIGYHSIEFIFAILGADPVTIYYINHYLSYWYVGFIFLTLTMVSGAILRGFGDTKTPSKVLFYSSILNGILDPFLIFGFGPIPRFEMQGAISATIIAWIFATVLSLYNIKTKTNFFDKKFLNINFYKTSIKKYFLSDIKDILSIGGPSILTNMINPIASSLIIKIVSLEGLAAVAAFGVGIRFEGLATLFSISMSIAMVPFVSINYGAKNHIRINQGLKYAIRLTLIIQLCIYILLFIFADIIAKLFSDDPEITNIIVLYLRILPAVYCFIGMIMIILSTLNAIERAKYSTIINLIRFFVLTIPLAYLGRYIYGVLGILVGIAIAKILAFIIGFIIYRKITVKSAHA